MSKMCPYMGECQMTCSCNIKKCYVKQVITQRNRAEEAYLNMQEMVIEMEAKMEKMTLDINKMARERAYEIGKQIDKLVLTNLSTSTLEKLIKMAEKELKGRM